MKSLDILLLEKESSNAKVFSDFFLNKNIEVDTLNGTIQAWKFLHENNYKGSSPQILFMFCNENFEAEINLIKKIRNNLELKSTLIFVFTGTENESLKKAALNLNVAACIFIPTCLDEINKICFVLQEYLSVIEFSRAINTT